MTNNTSKYKPPNQLQQAPCLWNSYLELKREVEELRSENEKLREKERLRTFLEESRARQEEFRPFIERRNRNLQKLFG